MKQPILIFSYGILQYENVQMRLYKRTLTMTKDTLTGYKTTGSGILTAWPTGKDTDVISGHVIEIATEAELRRTDDLEYSYDRVFVKTDSGIWCWLYTGKALEYAPGNTVSFWDSGLGGFRQATVLTVTNDRLTAQLATGQIVELDDWSIR